MWEMIPPKKTTWPSKEQRKYMGFQRNFVPGKSIAIGDSTVGFKLKIILKIYNKKTLK
jgi:hypothetical protein